jgi:hypothetical protein
VPGPVLGLWMSNEPTLASIAYWAVFGVWIGAVSRANAIRKQLRTTEERHP